MPTADGSTDVSPAVDSASQPLLSVENLRVHFPARRGWFESQPRVVKAVDGVSFELQRGRTLGLVGESGCGKTTLSRAILRLIAATSGRVRFEGFDVFALDDEPLRALRRRMQIVHQDPSGSLNPAMTVETIVGEALHVHRLVRGRGERRARVAAILHRVGLPESALERYPHELSGGQRQRVGIARALILEPSLIICDEPVSALDVSIQSQVLNLLADLQRDFELSYLLVAHNLAVVRLCCDEVAVMYLGRIVEQAPTDELFRNPRHPYTQALLAAAPIPDPGARRTFAPLRGEAPSPLDPPAGCAFHPRCPFAESKCTRYPPPLVRVGPPEPPHAVACLLVDSIPRPGAPQNTPANLQPSKTRRPEP